MYIFFVKKIKEKKFVFYCDIFVKKIILNFIRGLLNFKVILRNILVYY